MKNKKKFKSLFCCLIISIFLTAVMCIVIYYATDSPKDNTVLTILYLIWTFSLCPAFVYAFNWLKTKSTLSSFQYGLIYKFLGTIMPALFAPYFVVLFYKSCLKQ